MPLVYTSEVLKNLVACRLIDASHMTVYNPQALPPFVLDYQSLGDYGGSTKLDLQNGLTLRNTYIPEEVMLLILSFVDPKEVLKFSLVCRKWNRMIKSYAYWSTVYKRYYECKPKKLPWYVYYCLFSTDYFNTNLIKNGNGEKKFDNWELMRNDGDKFVIEDVPKGSYPKPVDVPEFEGKTSCFATSYETCVKRQTVSLKSSDLFSHIVNCYKPHIYLSDWTAARFDCGSVYKLSCIFRKEGADIFFPDPPSAINHVKQWAGNDWKKIELVVKEYPEIVDEICFEHEGRDTQFWAGHYGSKMAGAVMMFLFCSMEPLPIGEDNKIIPKKFSKSEYTSTGLSKEKAHEVHHLFARRLPYYEVDFDEFDHEHHHHH